MSAKKSDLLRQPKNGYDRISQAERQEIKDYCEGYKAFLDEGRTERECVMEIIRQAEERGYRPYVRGEAVLAGDKLYRVEGNKAVILAVISEESLTQGAVIGGAHIDNPRLDLKPRPLYEDSDGMARFKTHYYGGVRKYQWASIPLTLHGVVCLKDGTTVKVRLGEDPSDPQLTIPDLLPHLGDKQAKEPLWLAIKAEDLNIVVGSEPYPDEDEKDRLKLMVMDILNEKYGFVEEDFSSAELCAVPAFRSADVGLDRSLVGAFGQDDRVCAYAILKALFDSENTLKRTCISIFCDKEEIGSYGVTGMDSSYFDRFLADLCHAQGVNVNTCMERSFCLSADVTTAFDCNYPFAYEKHNACYINYGVALSKYTGSRGKSGASDASAEVICYARRVLDNAGVVWQIGELGRTDEGGGGTIAHYMARRGIPTLDAGTPVLAMHSPFEVTAKLDCYMTYRGMKAFFECEEF